MSSDEDLGRWDREAGVDAEAIEQDEHDAARRASSIEAGRRMGGVAGAAMAGVMLALRDIYEGPPPDEVVTESETPDEPGDIDANGISVRVGDVDVWSPPPDQRGVPGSTGGNDTPGPVSE